MELIETCIPGVVIVQPRIFGDERGYFFESFSQRDFEREVRRTVFVQDNESKSCYGVLRGLHFQKPPYAQSKLVRVVKGSVLDVAVDIRKGSPTFGKYVSVELTEENKRQFFIPRGFAHGFAVLSTEAVFQYKCDNFYAPESEGALAWDDPDLAIDWRLPASKVILSEKIKNIEDAAFKGCDNLKICQIRKKTAPNLLPEALADSVTAIFIPLGSSDAYRFKNRWEHFAFIEGEPLETTIQVGAMGKLEDEIMKAGLQPRDINFLTIEGKLDNADFKLIRDYMPNLVSLDISKTNATTIPDFTFAQKKYLLKIKLPHNLKTIGQRVFSNCGRLAGTLELPASVTAIEFGAFMGCDNLRYVLATGDKITTLGDELFGNGVPSKLIYKK